MGHWCDMPVVRVGGADSAGGATSTRKHFRSHLDVDVCAIPSRGCRNSRAHETQGARYPQADSSRQLGGSDPRPTLRASEWTVGRGEIGWIKIARNGSLICAHRAIESAAVFASSLLF